MDRTKRIVNTTRREEMNNEPVTTCYVRFFAEDLLADFIDMVGLFNKKTVQLQVTERMGTFEIQAVDGKQEVFDLVFHKYLSCAKSVRKEGHEKFHPAICSLNFIGMVERPIAV